MRCNRFVVGGILLTVMAFSSRGTGWAQDVSDFESPPNTQELSIPMTPPAEALKLLELPQGFQASLFAAEPDVHQPIAVTTDARGRLWVAECYTYSDRQENYNTQLNDRIVIFEDVDHDGVFDTKKVFWDQAKKLTSIEVGFGGVWATAAPNLVFIPDADQDDVPDGEPIVLLDGFEGDVIRHNIVNGLRWGPDGWLYGRHGIQATSLVGPPDATESQRTPMNCAIWRIHPIDHTFEIVAQGGTNPWGFDFDEHGEMFMINTVIGHLFHVVPSARYRRMYGAHFNPHTYQVIEQTADHFHWDVSAEGWADAKTAALSDGTDLAGGGHAHCGLMIYQGANWPREFHNKLLTANFHGRRINSDSIHREGNSYVAHHGPDYFKSGDPWFRGVELISGPDGGVYVLDWSDIGECHENDGIHRTSGRIFKISYGQPVSPGPIDLNRSSDQELIGMLAHKNQWFVRKARRLLQQRAVELMEMQREISAGEEQDALNSAEIALDVLSRGLREAYQAAPDANVKLRILWAYYSCGLDINHELLNQEQWLIQRLGENNEHLRAWAVRLLADGVNRPSQAVAQRFRELAAHDPSGLVRLYIASSLPRFGSDDAFRIANALATHATDANDRVQPKLIWFGIEPLVTSHVDASIRLARQTQIPLLRRNIARRITVELEQNPEAVMRIVKLLDQVPVSHAKDLLTGMTEALNGWIQADPPRNWTAVSESLGDIDDAELHQRIQTLNLVFGDGRAIEDLKRIVEDAGQDIATRRQAIATLASSSDGDQLFDFYKSHLNNKALTTEVIRALVRCDQPDAAKLILNRYPHLDPEGQSSAINTLVTRKPWARQLLGAVSKGRIARSAITASHARQINNFGDEQLDGQLAAEWGVLRQTSTELATEIARLRTKLTQETLSLGNHEKGRQVYEKNCASCHTLFGHGGKIGPDLTGSDRKNLNYLLENVVDPSASVAQGYQASVIMLEDGRFLTGVILEDNGRTVQLQTKDDVMAIDVTTIEERRKTNNSLMPVGLLDPLSDEDVANLFSFLGK